MLKRSAFLFIVAGLLLPGSAMAATTVAHSGSTTTIVGDADPDDVTVEFTYIPTPAISGNGFRVTNPQGVTPGPGCVPESTTAAVCPYGDGTVDAQLGEGGDQFRFSDPDYYYPNVITTVAGQGGSDTLGGAYGGELDGGAGDDTLRPLGFAVEQTVKGGDGSDVVELAGYEGYVTLGSGGGGTQVSNDVERLRGSSGDDYFAIAGDATGGHTFEGGSGYDTISYADRTGGVKVVLGGTGTDTVGEDVEAAVGGSGDDELSGNAVANYLSGGSGNDRLTGYDGSDTLLGGEGNDTLDAGAGDDEMAGAAGNDTLDGGPGEEILAGGAGGDTLRGGADKDTVSYYGLGYYDDYPYEPYDGEYATYQSTGSEEESKPGVTVTLDDQPNDGETAEGDNVRSDVEVVQGSPGDDTIVGGPGANEISGFEGKDRIDGGDGDDKIGGGMGDDVLAGGTGKDELRGGSDNDQIDGGPGEDLAIGQDSASETVDGVDLIELRDGERDAAACPAGLSRVLADQHDIVDQKCALIERFTLGPPGTPPPPPVGPSPLLRIHLKGTVVDRRGVARIRATCAPAPVPCAGRLSLYTLQRRKLRRLGGVEFAVPAGETRVIRVRLNKRGKRMVRTRRSVRTQVFVAHQDPKAKPIRLATIGLRRAGR
jgi:Ca2+-binding RTX toxin-like protein